MSAIHIGTEEGYALWAPTYDTQDNPMVALAAHAFAEGAPRLDGQKVLELGCGTGRNVGLVLGAGASAYVGVDSAAAMLARAEERAAGAPARFLRADLREPLPGHLRGFDAVLVTLVLEHVRDVAPVLRAAAEANRPGALFLAYELHPSLHAAGVHAHVRVNGADVSLPSHGHSAEELATALALEGWDVLFTRDWYASEEACARSVKLARYRGRPALLEVRARRR